MFAPSNWIQCQTATNGSCSYHAFAEVLVRIIRNHPQFINPMLFEPDSPVFKPLQDFLKHSLKLQEPLSLEALQRIFNDPRNKFSSDFIFNNVAPGILLLFLSHYRHTTKKIKPVYERIRQQALATEGWSGSLSDTCFERALEELHFVNPISSAEATQRERTYYLESLKMSLTGGETEQEVVAILSGHYNFLHEFLESDEQALTTEQAKSFINLIHNGFIPSEYADQGLLLNLAHILLRPSSITTSQDGHPNLTYPCGFGQQNQLEDVDPQHQPYTIYQCTHMAHFEYAISRTEMINFQEQASVFSWFSASSSISELLNFKHPSRIAPVLRCHSLSTALSTIEQLQTSSNSPVNNELRSDLSFSVFDYESLLSISTVASIFLVTAVLPLYLVFKVLAFALTHFISTMLALAGAWAMISASAFLYDSCYFNASHAPDDQDRDPLTRYRATLSPSHLASRSRSSAFSTLGQPISDRNNELAAQAIMSVTEIQTASALRFFEKSRPREARAVQTPF